MTDNVTRLRDFFDRVWNTGDIAAVDEFLGDSYTIFSDPGDPWDGHTLDREGFKQRLAVSRDPFPDLTFEITNTVSQGEVVAVAWIMRGTQTGPLPGIPATGNAITVNGMTMYSFADDGRIIGHRQVVDRMRVAQQLGLLG